MPAIESHLGVTPCVGQYLASLPAGLGAYPACEASASLLGGLVVAGVLEGVPLPAALSEIVAGASTGRDAWVPEVAHVATILAVRDARFGGADGDEAVARWVTEISRPLAVPGHATPRDPDAAVDDVPAVWARLHRGTTIEIASRDVRSARLVHRHPDGIFPSIVLEWRRRVLLAMLAASGAATPRADVTVRAGIGTEVALAW
jgi:hypothetical protein